MAATARERGRPASDKELGVVVSQIRRVLSTSFVQAQVVCLLARVGYLGGGDPAAADRRVVTRRQEEARRKERQGAHWAHVRGRGVLSHTGDIFH